MDYVFTLLKLGAGGPPNPKWGVGAQKDPVGFKWREYQGYARRTIGFFAIIPIMLVPVF